MGGTPASSFLTLTLPLWGPAGSGRDPGEAELGDASPALPSGGGRVGHRLVDGGSGVVQQRPRVLRPGHRGRGGTGMRVGAIQILIPILDPTPDREGPS